MTMRSHPLAALIVAAAIVGMPACVHDPSDDGYTCDMAHVGEVLSGTWRLHADGERVGCDDRRLEGDLELELSIPLDVTAMAVATSGDPTGEEPQHEADAFVERIRRADFELNADDMPDELELSGTTAGSCATIVLSERLPGGDRLTYTLNGYIVSSGQVEGTLTGEGPESCRVRGSFELTIQ
jgi:hypothetical protein